MQIAYSQSCPRWVKDRVLVAHVFFGDDPVRIAESLKRLTAPSLEDVYLPFVERRESLLFARHGLMVLSGVDGGNADGSDAGKPWMTIMPSGGMLNRDDICSIRF